MGARPAPGSADGPPPRPLLSRLAGARDALVTVALSAAAAVAIGIVRAPAAALEKRVAETSDVYVLPPPDEVVTLSLGYRSALADLLWSHVLVSQGLHTMERRRFENLTLLLDAINALDPTFRDPYLFADALITFQTSTTPHDEVVKAREIMERGVQNRPLDGEIWLALGQFVAFIAPASYLTDPAEKAQWRLDGARMLARAAELGGNDANISWQALGGAGILGRAGEREAQIRFLQRTLAVTDDEGLKQQIRAQLDKLLGEQAAEAYRRRIDGFSEIWRRDLPFVSKTAILVLGPPRDPAYCAGGAHADEPRCATTWSAWAERVAGER
ncbi:MULTISPECIES: hypothetical protein [Sorangium]|uniref:Uncharacterized protein n=1 Tax=Sorangium cellulosum TaxID=56 RepID=A0A4P2QTJ3_SORCE|nr:MULTISPECIES: hypothetical protein [Sorangium]AUX33416.1 hypothetical protein SOCE836_055760 [Sorangium cellulosum]WCQ92732.1 hypothetical protein NQZ70_05478 [Sorangium sp. Soce836]